MNIFGLLSDVYCGHRTGLIVDAVDHLVGTTAGAEPVVHRREKPFADPARAGEAGGVAPPRRHPNPETRPDADAGADDMADWTIWSLRMGSVMHKQPLAAGNLATEEDLQMNVPETYNAG
jgi:hypothetical protein